MGAHNTEFITDDEHTFANVLVYDRDDIVDPYINITKHNTKLETVAAAEATKKSRKTMY